jgi:predicted PurR-regulated permease PerM
VEVRRSSPRWDPTTKVVAAVALSVAALGAFYLARNALSLVALSGLIAFLVAPLIRLLTSRLGMPKVAALLVSYLTVLVGLLVIGALVVAGVVSSLSEIDPPEVAASLRTTAVDWLDGVRTIEVGSFSVDLSEAVDPLREALEDNEALDLAEEASGAGGATEDGDGSRIVLGRGQVETLAGGVLSSVRTVGGFLVAALVSALVTFLVAVYLSADSHKFHAGLVAHVPDGYEGDAEKLAERFGQIWKGYLYGQLANSLVTGLMVWIVLWAIGLPGAFVFGLIMALLNMIPTFGPIIAAVPGVLSALALGSTRLDWSNVTFALLVVGIYVLVVQVQANFMAPFITGRAVQMSPATILIGLIVGFQVGGLVGSLLVVPVLASLKEVARYVLAKLLDRDPFEQPAVAVVDPP